MLGVFFDGELVEAQSAATAETLMANAVAAGLDPARVVIREVLPEDRSPPPSLAEAKAAAIRDVRAFAEQVRQLYYPTGKEIDIRRAAPGCTQEQLTALDAFLDGTLNPVSAQAANEIEAAPDMAALDVVLAAYRELYGAELS